jgi:hypothetical protein
MLKRCHGLLNLGELGEPGTWGQAECTPNL